MLYPVRGMYNPEGICITGADFTNEARDNKKQLFAKFSDRRRPIYQTGLTYEELRVHKIPYS